ncbi:hypothetical protein C0992_009624 [Termitomyces sp. T32_za158]|nr:hypothetical protein C0992_009624 [Termitomyces sp. T32_za158]
MLALLAQLLVLIVFIWALRRFASKRDIDNIPGPERESFFKGNMAQMFNSSSVGWDFNSMISERCIGSFNVLHPVPMFNDIAKKLEKAIKNKLIHGTQEVNKSDPGFGLMTTPQIDVLHWMNRAALEMIGQSGLGYSFDPLVEGAMPHPFSEAAKIFIPTTSKMSLEIQFLLPTLIKIGSPKFRRWLVDHFPSKRLRAIRDIIDTWDRTTTEIFEAKKKALKEGDEALAHQIGQAKDLMSILNVVSRKPLKHQYNMMGNRTFAFAATDTTSNALSRTLHLLALHPETQERLRSEVIEARKFHNGNVPYDDLVSLPFMDAVCRETLRL